MNFFTKALYLLICCIYFPGFSINSSCGKAIIIMGASCAGKSTLSASFLQSRGDQWKLVELDVIEDQFKALGKDTADINLLDAIVAQSNLWLAQGCNVIIDTNIYHEVLRTISTDDKKFVFVYCPLEILMQRNAERERMLLRSAQRTVWALRYVQQTFDNFQNFDKYDVRVDSSLNNTSDLEIICSADANRSRSSISSLSARS